MNFKLKFYFKRKIYCSVGQSTSFKVYIKLWNLKTLFVIVTIFFHSAFCSLITISVTAFIECRIFFYFLPFYWSNKIIYFLTSSQRYIFTFSHPFIGTESIIFVSNFGKWDFDIFAHFEVHRFRELLAVWLYACLLSA